MDTDRHNITPEIVAEWFTRHRRFCILMCRVELGSEYEAEDVAQRVWLSLLVSRPPHRSGDPRPFIATVARRRARDHLRAELGRPGWGGVEARAAYPAAATLYSAPPATPEALAIARERLPEIEHELDHKPGVLGWWQRRLLAETVEVCG